MLDPNAMGIVKQKGGEKATWNHTNNKKTPIKKAKPTNQKTKKNPNKKSPSKNKKIPQNQQKTQKMPNPSNICPCPKNSLFCLQYRKKPHETSILSEKYTLENRLYAR